MTPATVCYTAPVGPPRDDERAAELRADVGDVIRRVRQRASMSEQALGERIGVSRATMRRYETGERPIPSDVLPALVEALGLSPWLFIHPPKRRVEVAADIDDYILDPSRQASMREVLVAIDEEQVERGIPLSHPRRRRDDI